VNVTGTPDPTPALVDAIKAYAPIAAIASDRVWEDPAPQDPLGQETVKVIVSLQTMPSEFAGGASHDEGWYAVQAVGPAAQVSQIRQLARWIDALLNNGPLTLAGFKVMGATRDSRLRRTEPEVGTGGVRWLWQGGLYRIFVVATS
jgi:hypothetical protein